MRCPALIETNCTSNKEPSKGAIRICFKILPMWMHWLLLLVGTCLTVHCNRAYCGNQPAENPLSSGQTKRPVTVADSIRMTRLGDSIYSAGATSKGITAKFSPDGKHFVVVLKKGNLESNTNEYSLVLFQTSEVLQAAEPRVLVSLFSASNRPAIDSVLWLTDNDTILFLGERPGEPTALYSLKCSSMQLTKLISRSTNLTSFATTAGRDVIVYAATNKALTFLTKGTARNGIAIKSELVIDLIRGNYGGNDFDDPSLWVQKIGKDSETKIAIQGRIWSDPAMSLSPDGGHLLIQTEATHISNTWSEYEDQFLKTKTHNPPKGGHTGVFQYELVDTTTGTSQILFDAPISSYGSEMAWSPDSKSVVVSDVYLPLNIDDTTEQALRKTHSFLAEFKISSREFVKISDADLRLLSWDSKTGDVACDAGRNDSFGGKTTPKIYFRKSGETWSQATVPEQAVVPPLPDILLDEDMNTPPRMVAIDHRTSRKSILMDLNPQFQNLALARVEEITWTDSHGNKVNGGLYWPPTYVAGKKYPLILQTHGWKTDRFWMDGPWTTAFAAQALASSGFFILQIPDPDWNSWATPDEAPRAMAMYEGALDNLDRRGLIDRNRVGIIGFSRTYWYVTYTLTHSKHRFAAAAIADGVDYSDFQYMMFSNVVPNIAGDSEKVFGGPPFGTTLSTWLKQSPAFLMDKIETPLRIQTIGPGSLLSEWHWYTGLSRLSKPVEMIYIPEGTHILEKPWDRMVSQQGNVDWFCFWLKDQEDPNPEKAKQYEHWRELRSLQNQNASTIGTQ